MHLNPSKAQDVVLATTVLHNFLADRHSAGTEEGFDEQSITDIVAANAQIASMLPLNVGLSSTGRPVHGTKALRDNLAQYFLGPGQVHWQEDACRPTSN